MAYGALKYQVILSKGHVGESCGIFRLSATQFKYLAKIAFLLKALFTSVSEY
jgi:hypothetical protein